MGFNSGFKGLISVFTSTVTSPKWSLPFTFNYHRSVSSSHLSHSPWRQQKSQFFTPRTFQPIVQPPSGRQSHICCLPLLIYYTRSYPAHVQAASSMSNHAMGTGTHLTLLGGGGCYKRTRCDYYVTSIWCNIKRSYKISKNRSTGSEVQGDSHTGTTQWSQFSSSYGSAPPSCHLFISFPGGFLLQILVPELILCFGYRASLLHGQPTLSSFNTQVRYQVNMVIPSYTNACFP